MSVAVSTPQEGGYDASCQTGAQAVDKGADAQGPPGAR